MEFDFDRLLAGDRHMVVRILGRQRDPDLVIAPNGQAYLYRWHVVPRNDVANVYLHVQTASDPERPLHDHPWDNTSVILAGGYNEQSDFGFGPSCIPYPAMRIVRKGQVIHRTAEEAHRLILPKDIPYTISLFSTGPKKREWGFHYPDGWRHHTKVTKVVGKVSTHVRETV